MAVVDQGQSIFDVAIQHCGDVTAVFDIAVLNGLSITIKLSAGSSLIMPAIIDAGLVQYFKDNGFIPASDAGVNDGVLLPSGIDYWAVGIDFIVS